MHGQGSGVYFVGMFGGGGVSGEHDHLQRPASLG